ncbi:FHA domain-containing protein [Brunnivagina elsteri]|uniref:Phosphopeptide-binding protein n=1 Tax=Brunnivagina elsteri CCALA 953 TaxID=987040 RepID=A0A2A2TP01_9CYAN|nr:FHA domain-containing protein [Calothrix elsteri]PAX60084.1 phosphopeptide-binding protein [Calothrix elsteri CCALA 953]
MPANKCSNSGCEYFNRPLPNNMECCPGCGRPLGNVIASAPAQSTPPPATPNVVSYRQQVQAPQPSQQQPFQQQILSENTDYQPHSPYIQPTPAQPPRLVRPVLKLIHTATGREFSFPGEEGHIGRRSQIHGTIPEIDLVGIPHEGVVSRSHARIFWDWNQNSYMILDTSRNGCYLNRNPLSPGVNYRLSNGDSLQLGQDGLVCFTVLLV